MRSRYTSDQFRDAANSIDPNHMNCYGTADMLRQAAEDAERLETLSTLGKHYGSDGAYRWLLMADQKCDVRGALDSIQATRTPKEQTK